MKRQAKRFKSAIIIMLGLAAALLANSAWANPGHRSGYHHGGGGRVSLYIGAPVLGYPYYGYQNYGYPYYGYPGYYGYGYGPYGYYGAATTVITTPAAAPVYIEQSNAANTAGPASDGFWYYCSNPDGYYPYVKQCAGAWQKVPPQSGSR